jgi:hypothetical protein
MRPEPLRFQVTVQPGSQLYEALKQEENGRRKSAEIQRLANMQLTGQGAPSGRVTPPSRPSAPKKPERQQEGGNQDLLALIGNLDD